MLTASDVMRMTEQKDVDGLIRVLQSDSDSHVRSQAATALGLLGDPKAKAALQNALQNTLLNNDFIVSGAASGALGVLEAKIATGAGIIQDKPADEIAESKGKIREGKLWRGAYWIGVLMLIQGCLIAGLTLYSLTDPTVVEIDWPVIIVCTGISIGLDALLMYVSTRPTKLKEPTKN